MNRFPVRLASFAIVVTVALGSVATTRPATAQGLLGAIFGALGLETRPQRPVPNSPSDQYPGVPGENAPEQQRSAGSGTSCVRMCDGRYFPVPKTSSGRALDTDKVCAALCPAAQTKVFNGSNMQYASASDGTRYADLPNAFAFRDRNIDDCSCTGQGPGGLAQIDVESDPTLRAGDVVMLASGPAIFRGSNQFPYRTADFTPVGDMNRVNNELKRKLSEIQVDPSATPSTPAQRLEPDAAPKPAPPPKPRPQPQAQPQRSGFPFFPFFQ